MKSKVDKQPSLLPQTMHTDVFAMAVLYTKYLDAHHYSSSMRYVLYHALYSCGSVYYDRERSTSPPLEPTTYQWAVDYYSESIDHVLLQCFSTGVQRQSALEYEL